MIIICFVCVLLLFFMLKRCVKMENINFPVMEVLMVTGTYGALLFVVLISLLRLWSGMASLASFYLILVAPPVMGIIAFRNRKKKTVSKYHRRMYLAGLLYFVIAPVIFLIISDF